MPSESTSMSPPSTATTHVFWSAEPKRLPVSAATTPSAVYMTQMPSTYSTAVATTFGRASFFRAPNTLTVTPIIGNTHGVRFRSSPPANSAKNHTSPPPASADSSLPRAVPPPAGALSNELKPARDVVSVPVDSAVAVLDVAPAAVTFTCTVNGTDTGARQTWSLQAWYSTVPFSTCDVALDEAAMGTVTLTVPS